MPGSQMHQRHPEAQQGRLPVHHHHHHHSGPIDMLCGTAFGLWDLGFPATALHCKRLGRGRTFPSHAAALGQGTWCTNEPRRGLTQLGPAVPAVTEGTCPSSKMAGVVRHPPSASPALSHKSCGAPPTRFVDHPDPPAPSRAAGNKITDDGCWALVVALFNNFTLKALDCSGAPRVRVWGVCRGMGGQPGRRLRGRRVERGVAKAAAAAATGGWRAGSRDGSNRDRLVLVGVGQGWGRGGGSEGPQMTK